MPSLLVAASLAPAVADRPYLYPPEAEDANIGDVLTFSLEGARTGMTVDPATGELASTPRHRSWAPTTSPCA